MAVVEFTSVHSLIEAIEQADSPDRLVRAVQALAAAQSPAGIPMLIKVLGFNNPGAAAVAVQGLVQLGATAVQPLLELLDDYNYGARAWAIRALVAIADPRALEVLLAAAAADFAPSVRRAATKGLGTLHWQLLPPEQAAIAQARALEVLLQITQDVDWSLRYAAVAGLQALAASGQPDQVASILAQLQQLAAADADLAVNARARFALDRLTAASSIDDRSRFLPTQSR